jgi:hypothetical protein
LNSFNIGFVSSDTEFSISATSMLLYLEIYTDYPQPVYSLFIIRTFRWIPGALSLGVKRPGREADHSPNTPSWRGAQLNHRGNFTFTFIDYPQDSLQLKAFFIVIVAS